VRNGENGFVVRVRDSRTLADALRKLIDDPEMRRRMGEMGREMAVAEFSTRRVTRSMLGIYAELLGTVPRCADAQHAR
jgi:glycosyltransferase involved in cell wall biosynthesis